MKKRLRNRKSIRAPWWDYGFAGWYSVTIRVHFPERSRNVFGNIENDKMYLNDAGRIVEEEWLKSPVIRKDMNIILDEYQVMPDHFHGIMQIGQNEFNSKAGSENDGDGTRVVVTRIDGTRIDGTCIVGTRIVGTRIVGTRCSASLQQQQQQQPQTSKQNCAFGPQSKNLSITINQFKGAVTRRTRVIGTPIEWQERFHDRIIRNQDELDKLRQYIRDNPKNWKFGDEGNDPIFLPPM